MSRGDSHELTAALATLIRAYEAASELVMRELQIDRADADLIVATIRFGIRAPMLTWAYSDAMNRARVIGVDFIKLRAMMHEGEGTQGSSGGEL